MMIGRLTFGLTLFVGSLGVGWWLSHRRVLTEPVAQQMIRFVVKRLSPIVLCLSFWKLPVTNPGTWLLPLIGCLVSLSTLLPAWGYARWAGLSRPQTGSFLVCAVFSNLGFLGAFTAFALFGEVAYSLAMLYLMYFNPCFYSLGFALAKRFGERPEPASSDSALLDELRFYPFLGLLVGAGLSAAQVPRPLVFETVNHALIPIDTVLYLIAIGSQLRMEPMGQRRQAGLAMSAIKFWYSPLVGWALVEEHTPLPQPSES